MKKVVKVLLSLMFLATLVSGCNKDVAAAGFKLGQKIDVQDEDTRAEYSLGKPVKIHLEDAEYSYDECKVLELVDDDFDTASILVSEDKRVIALKCAKNFRKYADARLGLDEMFRAFSEKYQGQFVSATTEDMEYSFVMKDGSSGIWSLKENSRVVEFSCFVKELSMMQELERKNRTCRMDTEFLSKCMVENAISTLMEDLESHYRLKNEEFDEYESLKFANIKSNFKEKLREAKATNKKLENWVRALETFIDDESDDIIRNSNEFDVNNLTDVYQRKKWYDGLKQRLYDLMEGIEHSL